MKSSREINAGKPIPMILPPSLFDELVEQHPDRLFSPSTGEFEGIVFRIWRAKDRMPVRIAINNG